MGRSFGPVQEGVRCSHPPQVVTDEIAGVNTASLGRCLHSLRTKARWVEGFHDDSMATCLIWRSMGSIRLYPASESPWNDNTTWVDTDHPFHHTPGLRWSACYWCNIQDLCKRQHYHQHRENKDTKSCWETPGTNTWIGDRHRQNILQLCEMR